MHVLNRLALLSIALVAIGCSGVRDSDVTGKWVGRLKLADTDIARAPQTDPSTIETMRQDAEKPTIVIDLKPDGTFTFTVSETTFSDEWWIEGSTVILGSSGTIKGASGGEMPNGIPMRLQVVGDKDSLEFTDPNKEMDSKVVFKRG